MNVFFKIAVINILFILLSLNNFLHADENCKLESASIPKQIKIDFTPESISNVNQNKNNYEIVYYLGYEYQIDYNSKLDCLISSEKILDWVFNPRLEIMKSNKPTMLSDYNISIDKNKIFVGWKAMSKVENNFDFSFFPFDKQNFQFPIMGFYSSNEVKIIGNFFNESSFKNFEVEGWKVVTKNIQQVQEEWEDTTYDRLIYVIQMEREYISFVFRYIIPMGIITLFAFISILLPKKELESKITIQASSLISIIAFNLVLDSAIPQLSYLTLMDIFTTLSLFLVFSITFFTIIFSKKKLFN